jgi:hypothetical protein
MMVLTPVMKSRRCQVNNMAGRTAYVHDACSVDAFAARYPLIHHRLLQTGRGQPRLEPGMYPEQMWVQLQASGAVISEQCRSLRADDSEQGMLPQKELSPLAQLSTSEIVTFTALPPPAEVSLTSLGDI